jgi:hypothetical protein
MELSRMNIEIQRIVVEEMAALKMNDRAFQSHLNEKLSPESETYLRSHATIINWRMNGKPPATDFLEDLVAIYPVSDRRFLFGLKLLAVKSPHIWGPDGVIWTLKKSRVFTA